MAINSKDIEALWKRYSDEGVKKGISVVQFFESNGVPYHTLKKGLDAYSNIGVSHPTPLGVLAW